MKLYLSSTYKGLKIYRAAIVNLFNSEALSSRFTLLPMDGFVAKRGIRTLNALKNNQYIMWTLKDQRLPYSEKYRVDDSGGL